MGRNVVTAAKTLQNTKLQENLFISSLIKSQDGAAKAAITYYS